MSDAVPQIYLDASVIQPILFPSGHNRDDVAGSEAIRDSLRGPVSRGDLGVAVPEVALGEAVSNYLETNMTARPGHLETLSQFINNLSGLCSQLDIRFAGMSRRGVRYAHQLVEDNRELGYNDAYISACAIDDKYSQRIISKDPDIVDCDDISDKARDFRGDRLYDLILSYEY